jgi:1-phosphofructokinase family hexose kinase
VIVVLSLNTAVDRVNLVPHFEAGKVYRSERIVAYAGGKGLNVARALRRLGQPVRVVGFLGGAPSNFIQEHCAALGIEQHWVEIEGESRTCMIVADPESNDQTVVNEPGPEVTDRDLARLKLRLRDSTTADDILCISGSAPPGVPDDFYAQIVTDVQARGARTLADINGTVLRLTLDAHPWAAAPNNDETAAAFSSDEDPVHLVQRLAGYVEHALLTLGSRGILYDHNGCMWRLEPPLIQTVNAVGSGDAFAAGFLAGIERGLEPLEAVKLGIACGASNASRLEPEIGPQEEIQDLARHVRVTELSAP